jgi:hypothetical protein
VTVASWILYVANERKINSPFGNFLTKIIIFELNKLSTEKNLCITRLENVLQVLALVRLGWRLCSTNRACTCKIAFSILGPTNRYSNKKKGDVA